MRKVITIAILIVLAVLPLCATTTYPAVSHYMIGRVDTVVEFNVEMLEEVLPFDLEGADVAYKEQQRKVHDQTTSLGNSTKHWKKN